VCSSDLCRHGDIDPVCHREGRHGVVSHCGPLLVIEFLASIEPASIPLLAVLAFSLSLYPLGFMLGASCSPCCDIPCEKCETGRLPDTVTVTFDGYPDTGPPVTLLSLEFFSCYGYGAAGTAQVASQPGPITSTTVTNGGSGYAKLGRVEPTITADGTGGTGADITVTLTEESDFCELPYWTVSSLTVVDGGEDYNDGGVVVFSVASGDTEEMSAYGIVSTSRDEPELTVEPPEDTGSGATFTVTLADAGDAPDLWEIDSITVTDGGTGYSDGDFASVGLGSGDVEQTPATLVIRTVRDEPELTLSGTADLTVNVASLGGTPELWEISSITVDDGGSGYSDEQYLNIVPGADDVVVDFPSLRIKTVRDEPTLAAQLVSGGGSGAILTVTVVQSGDVWVVSGVTVVNGGSGYTQGQLFDIVPSVGQTVVAGQVSANVTGGVITSLSIDNAGEYFLDTGVIEEVVVDYSGLFFKDTGVIESVDVSYGGLYYKNLGDIQSISLVNGGIYYREDAEAEPYVADVAVTVFQLPPSAGTGAELSVVIDDDPESETFGQITGVTVDDGGSGYDGTATPNSYCTGEYMNGRPFVLARQKFFGETSAACRYSSTALCDPLGHDPWIGGVIWFELKYDGSTSVIRAPHVSLTTDESVADCGDFSLEFPANSPYPYFAVQREAFNGVSATVVSGGGSVEEATDAPPPGSCGSCCLNQDEVPSEITVAISDSLTSIADGDYVMARNQLYDAGLVFYMRPGALIWWTGVPFSGSFFLVRIEPCAALSREPGLEFYDFWESDSFGCENNCYKKCRIVVIAAILGGVINSYDEPCDCDDFPVCSPSGTFSLSGLVTATIV
jgi:hypothetical protein